VVPGFIATAEKLDGVIYHLKDGKWVLPALHAFSGKASIVYNKTTKDNDNAATWAVTSPTRSTLQQD
jgi:hypothetical protein